MKFQTYFVILQRWLLLHVLIHTRSCLGCFIFREQTLIVTIHTLYKLMTIIAIRNLTIWLSLNTGQFWSGNCPSYPFHIKLHLFTLRQVHHYMHHQLWYSSVWINVLDLNEPSKVVSFEWSIIIQCTKDIYFNIIRKYCGNNFFVNIPGPLHMYSGMIKNDYITIIKAFVLKEKHFVQINKSWCKQTCVKRNNQVVDKCLMVFNQH